MKQLLASLLLAFAIMLPAHAQLVQSPAPANQTLDRIVAVVNDDVILQSDLDEAVQAIQQQYAGQAGQLPPMNVLKRQLLNRLILMRLQVQKAQEQGITVSNADIDRAVQGVAQQNKMTPEQLRAAVEQQGSSFAAFREQLSDQLTVQRLHQSVVQSSVSVTDSEIDNLLSSPNYKAGEVHLAHIQVTIPSGADAAAIQASQAKADKALAAINGGMDFNAAAIRYSDAPDALDGGDLGWRRMDEIPAAFADMVEKLKPGQVSQIMRGPTGFHIIKLIGERKGDRKMVTEFHARQILIKPDALLTSAQAQQKAQELYNRIVNKHEDFAALAKEYSKDDTTANLGGDMGWFKPDAWGQAIASKLAELKDDQVSEPFQTEAGWHIIKRLGTRQSDQTVTIERDEARQAIGNRKAEQAYDDFLRDLRSNAYIHILVPDLREADKSSADVATPQAG
ncbi:MAG: peptidylprolyl isomerase [Rhodanobacter sp.]